MASNLIPKDCWQHIFSFCTPIELCHISCISKTLNSSADNAQAWEFCCAVLWTDKQNHPLERWVEIYPKFSSQDDNEIISCFLGAPKNIKLGFYEVLDFDEHYNTDMSNVNANQVMAMHDGILEELTVMQDRLAVGDPEALTMFTELVTRLQNISYHLNRAKSLKKLAETRAMDQINGIRNFRRKYAPASRAARARLIREERTYLVDHRYRVATSLSPEISERILSAMNINIDGKSYEDLAEKLGILLTWKESYRESLKDSKRRCITFEELREQGDWYILFETTLEMARFVYGGTHFIDQRAFCDNLCSIGLNEDRLYFRNIRQAATVFRTPDWGWEIAADNGFVWLASFDRVRGREQYDGRLRAISEVAFEEVDLPDSPQLKEPYHSTFVL
eukprot:gene12421-26127_t